MQVTEAGDLIKGLHDKLPHEREDLTLEHGIVCPIKIGEQQVAQEETEKLYMQQFAVLKGEIQQQKQSIDRQTVVHESLRNIVKKMMHLWIDDEDNYDDF